MMIAYHNTNAEFDKFHKDFIGKSDYGYAGKGFYFMPYPLGNSTYGKYELKVELDLKNPYRRTIDNWKTDNLNPYSWIPARTEYLNGIGMERSEALKKASSDWTVWAEILGYDGFVDEAVKDGEIVAFHPEQITIISRGQSMKKNPPSPDFDELGIGSAAAAYRNKNLVEIITKSKRKEYDISRDVVIEARELLPESLKKYLPVIHRKRIDKMRNGTLEFIYEMPFYNKVTQGPEEPDSYTNYRKYGYDYPTEPELRKIESVLNSVMRGAYEKAGIPHVRKKAKFDGSYEHQDSLVCGPIFNIGWYKDGNKKVIVFRDPLFAWMPVESILKVFGSKFPENKSNRVILSVGPIARYLKGCLS